jgi:DNA-binding protein Fis
MTECPRDLAWIANVPGNFYVGFATSKPRQICFSEINIPTSWPNAYRYDVREDTVGLAVSGNTVFVLTVGQPYAISGTDPKGMTVSRIASNQGCVSKYSICTMNNAVFYASQDGVCMLSEGSQTEIVMTKSMFTKDQWTELNPSSCLMATHDAALHMFFEKLDGTRVAYVLDMIEGNPVLTTQSDVANAVYADVESDGLYIIKEVTA